MLNLTVYQPKHELIYYDWEIWCYFLSDCQAIMNNDSVLYVST